MSADDKAPRRSNAAIVVATAAVTLAIGVTTAALTGHLAPRREPARSAEPQRSTAATKTAPAPSVVLVPVADDKPAKRLRTRLAPTTAPVLAAAHADDDDDDDGHHRRARDDDDDEEHEDD